ncbi:MAG: exodeoxyribonuclease VII large subunit [Gammaproteobacteria bacterium]|nr:exodeoxyribonuclease VII large subunit [Gammaproteobacteria bacterium]
MKQQPDTSLSKDSSVFTVSMLNSMARELLEECFPAVTVEAEISNLSIPASGHWYLTLKDDSAQIRCAMFRNRNMSVRFRPANGMQVTVKGKLSLYEGRGDYQLILESMSEAGAGALQRAFEALKQKLLDEGLFDTARKKPVPEHCRHIAVITSPTGAVIRDILSVFNRRFPGMQVTVLPVPVQGAEAAPAIIKALETVSKRQQELGFDAVILARGGGSLEDLQAFNDEAVARAIADCPLPTVSAIGHETDVSIADFVADVRAPTPSAAAELLSPDQRSLLARLVQTEQKLHRQINSLINQRKLQLQWLQKRLQHPGRRLQEQAQTLDRLDTQLKRAMQHILQQQKIKLQMLAKSLDTVSPLQTIQRGFSITQNSDGRLITAASQVKPGEQLTSILKAGKIVSTVDSIRMDD